MSMIYRKSYTCSQKQFKEMFMNKTICSTYSNKIQTVYSSESGKRVYFGSLDNCRFDLYSWPDRMGPWCSKPWVFPWRGMAMWVAPAHAFGTIYGTKDETIIDYYISKSRLVKRFLVIAFIIYILELVPPVFTVVKFGFAGIMMILTDLLILSLLISVIYIPEKEKKALIEFLDSLTF